MKNKCLIKNEACNFKRNDIKSFALSLKDRLSLYRTSRILGLHENWIAPINNYLLSQNISNCGWTKEFFFILFWLLCMCAQLCTTVCDPTDCSPPGSSVHGIFFQAIILEWVAISSSRDLPDPGRDWPHVACVSHIGKWIPYHEASEKPSDFQGSLFHKFCSICINS